MPLFKSYDEMLDRARSRGKKTVAVASAEEDSVLLALKKAQDEGMADAILLGCEEEILRIARDIDYPLHKAEIVDLPEKSQVAREAVRLVSTGSADLVMKGMLHTDTLMHAVLDKEVGLRTGKIISHVFMFTIPGYHKFIFLTDGGINIAPNLSEKKAILENAITMCHALGLETPKTACIAAVEDVNEKMQATIDAACLSKMAERGQIKGAIVDGPLALDNALSQTAAREKGIRSPVAGDADILLVPSIEVGNALFKALDFFGGARAAGVAIGMAKPVVITSRADSTDTKFLSIALAVLLSEHSSG